MVDLLIKNMEMPTDCEECKLATVNGFMTWCPLKKCFIKIGYSFKDCPLVALPKHGRLIDAEELKNLIVWASTCNNGLKLSDILELIDDASTTVLEASE